jgi:hypothetical protein
MAYTGTALTTAQKQSGTRIVRTTNSDGSKSYSAPKTAREVATDVDKVSGAQLQKMDAKGAFNAPVPTAPKAPQQPMAAPKAPLGSVQAPQPEVSFEQAKQNLQAGGADQSTIASATNILKAKYNQGLQADISTGTEAGQNLQDGLGQVSQFAQTQQESPSVLGGLMEVDNNFDSIFTSFDELMSPESQHTSLVEEYSKLSKSLGIEGLNEKLINAQRIIDGTEDDIRSEVTAAGGFATESQVLAMSNARNKSLIKNYNALLATRDNAMQQLNTMMQLSVQDRQFAEAEFDRKLNFAFKVQEFKERVVESAREGYNNIVKSVGYSGLSAMMGGDSYSTQLAERALGLGQGGLARLAALPPDEDTLLDRQYKKAQIANIYSEIGARGGGDNPFGVSEKTMGKIQASPEYKTISAVLPAINALKAYKDAITKYGTTETLNGTGKGTLAGTYGNALAAWKTLAGLGALSGADFGLAENAVPETGFFRRTSTSQAKLEASLQNAITQTEAMTKRLAQNYPDASELLNRQLDDTLVTAYPDKYFVGEDGQVYELAD